MGIIMYMSVSILVKGNSNKRMIISVLLYSVLMLLTLILPQTAFFYFILHGGFGWKHLLAYCVGVSVTSLMEDSKKQH